MCGITGFLNITNSTSAETLNHLTILMSSAIQHRGPDDSGIWIDPEGSIALGFRRLAILDISPTGHQPMQSADRRFVIIFNGEVYNYRELREELLGLGASFQGTSDTEVMLAAFSQWGVLKAVQRFNGMFVFAVWDCQERTLFLVRDRLGIKPLYYGWQGETLLFGSELKALRAHPAFQADIDRDALTLYLRHNYIPAPHSIYKGIYKLPPGCILTIRTERNLRESHPEPYWVAHNAVEQGLTDPFLGSEKEAIDTLNKLLLRSVGQRMIADVPLGAFLSGGIDSSMVVALMQAQSNRPVKTFTIGFHETGFDEARHALAVAKHLGTEHTELYVTPEEAQTVIPLLPSLYDEPFSDSSQIPTYLVSQLARREVTVALSGDGGDELFGGYKRYFTTAQIWNNIRWMPLKFRKILAGGIQNVSAKIQTDHTKTDGRALLSLRNLSNIRNKTHRLVQIINAPGPQSIYHDLVSHWKEPQQVVLNGNEPITPLTDPDEWAQAGNLIERMMYLDTITYLPGDILAKVDRASMGVSLEARAPYLDDHEVIEFAWRLPFNMKVRSGQGKWILRQVLNRYVPKKLIERPKMGFGVPIDSWLRGPLRGWAEELLDENRIRQEGFFDPSPIRKMLQEHLSGERNRQYYLWDILMFQAWLNETRSK